MAIKRSNSKKKGITLRDVVSHIQGVKGELSTEMKHMEQRLTKRIDGLETRINEVEENLSNRIDDLGKDIDATMVDTIKIRQHVGMALPNDE